MLWCCFEVHICDYWNRTTKASDIQAKEIEEHSLTPGKYREGSGDIGVYMALEWAAVKSAALLDGGELKPEEFYRGVISATLLTRKHVNGDGWEIQYKSPIAYCVSQLEKLASSSR